MKRTIIISIWLSILAYAPSLYSQPKLQFEVGGGYVFNMTSNALLGNYSNGWMIRLGANYTLTPSIHFIGNISYNHYSFLRDNRIITLPGNEAPVDAGKEDARIVELSVAAKLSNSGKLITPFITIGGGVFFNDFDRLEKSYWIQPHPGARPIFHNAVSEGTANEAFVTVGLGTVLPLTSKLNWVFEGRFVTTYYGNDVFPITTSIRFGF